MPQILRDAPPKHMVEALAEVHKDFRYSPYTFFIQQTRDHFVYTAKDSITGEELAHFNLSKLRKLVIDHWSNNA